MRRRRRQRRRRRRYAPCRGPAKSKPILSRFCTNCTRAAALLDLIARRVRARMPGTEKAMLVQEGGFFSNMFGSKKEAEL
eukprot:2619531-Rhodomonas_salina.9